MFFFHFLDEGSLLSLNNGRLVVGAGERQEFSEDSSSDLFYFQNYFLTKEKPWHRHRYQKEMSLAEFKAMLQEGTALSAKGEIRWRAPERTPFGDDFTGLQTMISNKKLIKGVPYVMQQGDGTVTPELLCRSLLAAVEAAERYPLHLYGTWRRGQGVLGATPELLFERNGNELHTVACAGTVPCAQREGCCTDPKLRHEHEVVVEAIMEALSPFGKVARGPLGTVELKNLIHLLTPIAVMLHDDPQFASPKFTSPKFTSIVHAMHPTPALGAYPRAEGMAWLRGLNERMPRNYFGAPVGYRGAQERAICYVAIRNMQWEADKVQLGAGCGVVEGSCMEAEWQELQLKLKSIKELLRLPMEA